MLLRNQLLRQRLLQQRGVQSLQMKGMIHFTQDHDLSFILKV